MSVKTNVELKNFFIFNSLYGPKEGEELKKILYYYPITDVADVQIKNVGLVEGIIQFTSTFKPKSPVNSLHSQKLRQLYYQPEKNFWLVMTLNLPTVTKSKDSSNQVEYLEDEIQDDVYEAVLQQSYFTYRLFCATFEQTIEKHDIGTLKTKLENFFKPYITTLNLQHSDILSIFCGIQYLPLDKLTFLKVQCFLNSLECNYPLIENIAFLYNDHLIWSGLEPEDMKIVYQYIVNTLLPATMETELQGGSMPRNSSPFAALHHGRFVTSPGNIKTAKKLEKMTKVHLYASGKAVTYYLVVYRALSASVCLFMKDDEELSLQMFKEMDEYLSQKLTPIVSEISDYCSKQVITPSNVPENVPRFIYFNKLNLAYKSTVHLDNKQSGNIACTKESLKLMADMKSKKKILGLSSEMIVKTMNDYWVVAKNSNSREFYVALQQKNASLIDISEEIKKLSETELKGIFFHPM